VFVLCDFVTVVVVCRCCVHVIVHDQGLSLWLGLLLFLLCGGYFGDLYMLYTVACRVCTSVTVRVVCIAGMCVVLVCVHVRFVGVCDIAICIYVRDVCQCFVIVCGICVLSDICSFGDVCCA